MCMYKCVYIFLSVCGVFKCTLYERVNKSVGSHACVRVRDMSTHTRTLSVSCLSKNSDGNGLCVCVCVCICVCLNV